jgi:predicted GH43/DUF377 family glycosyl hydrolase
VVHVSEKSRERVSIDFDRVPGLSEQANALGGTLQWVRNDLLLPDQYHYNASIALSGKLLCYRSETNYISTIGICEMRHGQPVRSSNTRILLPRSDCGDRHEDPRIFECDGKLWISYVCVSNGSVGIQIARLSPDMKVLEHIIPGYGRNFSGAIQKNWSFFGYNGEIFFVYLADPHEVVSLRGEKLVSRVDGVRWRYGTVRGGTPPIRVGDRFWTFFHSRRLEGNRWRYYMGAYSFMASPPFAPISMTPVPLLAASGRDPQLHRLPLVVFPCGAIKRKGGWIVSLGVNDVNIALFSIGDDALENCMESVQRTEHSGSLTSLPERLG